MTRKDYVLVAATIRKQVDGYRALNVDENGTVMAAVYTTVHNMAIAFAGDNPCFDMTRFFKACGFHDA